MSDELLTKKIFMKSPKFLVSFFKKPLSGTYYKSLEVDFKE